MILHIIQAEDTALTTCLRYMAEQDTLLLCGDAVNLLLQVKWQQALAQRNVLLLQDDVEARGLGDLLANYCCITQQGFVQQTLLNSKVITW